MDSVWCTSSQVPSINASLCASRDHVLMRVQEVPGNKDKPGLSPRSIRYLVARFVDKFECAAVVWTDKKFKSLLLAAENERNAVL